MEKFNDTYKGNVKLVGDFEGSPVVIGASEALHRAEEDGLDLITVGTDSNENIPIVKIADYNKLIFEKKRKDKENLKKQKQNNGELKEVRLGSNIADHDIETKAKNIEKFIKHGDTVMITLRYKGRSVKLIESGKDIIDKLLSHVEETYTVKKPLKIEENKVFITIAPKHS